MILSFSPIAADARVLKQVRLFASRYDVTTCGYGPAPDGVVRHVRVPDEVRAWKWDGKPLRVRAYGWAYRHNPGVSWVREHLPPATFDGILADDLEAVGLALWLRPRRGVHADLHEYSPRQNEQYPQWDRWVRPFMEWMVRTHVRQAMSVTTVGAHIAREYETRFGLPHIGVVPNAAPYAPGLTPTPTHTPLRLVHSGAARPERGLENHIDAIAGLPGITLDLLLTQNTTPYFHSLQQRAATTPNVRVLDPVPYDDLITTLNTYDVGIYSLPPANFNTTWAVPNKIYDFVQARLALVIGPSPEMADIVRSHGIGVIADDFTATALRAATTTLTTDTVTTMKHASDQHAWALSADQQMHPWTHAITTLLENPDTPHD
ncbi:glycosyltransferase family 4 protein [Brachybacterium huguangmaarense]